jgi:hypothetical protein
MTDSSEQIAIRMSPDLLAWLRRQAESEHRTLSSMIRALLEDARTQATPGRAPAKQREVAE